MNRLAAGIFLFMLIAYITVELAFGGGPPKRTTRPSIHREKPPSLTPGSPQSINVIPPQNVASVIIPRPQEDERLRPVWHEEWWKKIHDKFDPPFHPENINFVHDRHLFDRVFSMSAARNWRNDPFWFWIAVLWLLGIMAFNGVYFYLKFFVPYVPYLPTYA